jgi:hypothetical protein
MIIGILVLAVITALIARGLEDWLAERRRRRVASERPQTPTPPPEMELPISDIDWATVCRACSSDSGQTVLQREERWKQFAGKKIKWTGVVRSVFENRIIVGMEQIDGLDEVRLWPKKGTDRAQLLALNKNDAMTFTGILSDGDDFNPRVYEAEILQRLANIDRSRQEPE